MSNIRTFIAVLLSDDLKRTIASVQDEFKKAAPDLKWVAPDNVHVTLKFLGSIEEGGLEGVYSAVRRAAVAAQPFKMSVVGTGAFPNPHRPRVVWVGIGEGEPELSQLAARVECELEDEGFPKEEKKFLAHITIARARENGRAPDLGGVIDEGEKEPFGVQAVERIVVMKSELLPKGPIYTALREFELSEPAERET